MGGSIAGMLVAPAIGKWLDYSMKVLRAAVSRRGRDYLIALGDNSCCWCRSCGPSNSSQAGFSPRIDTPRIACRVASIPSL